MLRYSVPPTVFEQELRWSRKILRSLRPIHRRSIADFPMAGAEKPFSGKRVFAGEASRFRKVSGKTVSPGNYLMPGPICIDWKEGSRGPVNYERRRGVSRKRNRQTDQGVERERERGKIEERNVRRIMRFRSRASGWNRVKKFAPVLANFRFSLVSHPELELATPPCSILRGKGSNHGNECIRRSLATFPSSVSSMADGY